MPLIKGYVTRKGKLVRTYSRATARQAAVYAAKGNRKARLSNALRGTVVARSRARASGSSLARIRQLGMRAGALERAYDKIKGPSLYGARRF